MVVAEEIGNGLRSCPREDCDNTFTAGQIVCGADFTALASSCRGKKRLGRPLADLIASQTGRIAYACALCREWHNGGRIRHRMPMLVVARATVRALRDDPRAGRLGLARLADAWHPRNVNRSCWAEGLDQAEALAAP
jgi:hypothetical protein